MSYDKISHPIVHADVGDVNPSGQFFVDPLSNTSNSVVWSLLLICIFANLYKNYFVQANLFQNQYKNFQHFISYFCLLLKLGIN